MKTFEEYKKENPDLLGSWVGHQGWNFEKGWNAAMEEVGILAQDTPAEDRYGREPKEECKECVFYHKLVPGNCVSVSTCKHQQREPDKVKPLAQYLDEYIDAEIESGNISQDVAELYAYDSWCELLQQALNAYQSTENVKIRIEPV